MSSFRVWSQIFSSVDSKGSGRTLTADAAANGHFIIISGLSLFLFCRNAVHKWLLKRHLKRVSLGQPQVALSLLSQISVADVSDKPVLMEIRSASALMYPNMTRWGVIQGHRLGSGPATSKATKRRGAHLCLEKHFMLIYEVQLDTAAFAMGEKSISAQLTKQCRGAGGSRCQRGLWEKAK